jgi:cell division protein FtsQ
MKVNWKQTIVILLDVAIAVYLLFAVTVFNRPDDKATVCTEVNIDVADGQSEGILTPAEVKQLLLKQRAYPLAQPMQFVSTRKMEEVLVQNPFVADAECYKTQNGHVCIRITQRRPVLHVMPASGEQYYLDANGDILPHTKLANDLLVATGAISRKYAQERLAPIAAQLVDDSFWQDQTVQLNVLSDGTLELIPRVGDHVVYLGAPINIPQKLERLRKFYKYGLSHAGWDRYERISVEFDNQIICKKHKS